MDIDNILFKTRPNIQEKTSYSWYFNINHHLF